MASLSPSWLDLSDGMSSNREPVEGTGLSPVLSNDTPMTLCDSTSSLWLFSGSRR